jgi:transposase InsO family protein
MGRHGAGHVRHLMGKLRTLELSTRQVAEDLGLTERRIRQLYREYLEFYAQGKEPEWVPGQSGGYRGRVVPEPVEALWRKMLGAKPPAPYAFVASEALRLHQFHVDRATVRRWAFKAGCAHVGPRKKPRAAVRRWQCADVGALWQLDATPHRWFGDTGEPHPLLDMVDDCSRVVVGAKLYPHECLLAYMDFLPRAFQEYGFPLALYVDFHSFFFTNVPDNLTYLGDALRRYDISLKYAPTPQAKGKVERLHQFWQNRLPSYFAAEGIQQIELANPHLDPLRHHHNTQELHRELGMIPHEAWRKARRESRYVLRPFQPDPWWKYVWSVRQRVRVGLDGTVCAGTVRLKIGHRFNSFVVRCDHPDGSMTFLANEPGSGGKPIVLLKFQGNRPLWTS